MNDMYGTSQQTVDDKWRFRIVSKYLPPIPEGSTEPVIKRVSMIAGPQGCIKVYEPEVLKAQLDKRLSMLPDTLEGLNAKRKILSSVEPADVDKQYRVVIPPALRAYANLKKEIVTVGMGDHFEIWSKEAQDEHDKSMTYESAFAMIGYL